MRLEKSEWTDDFDEYRIIASDYMKKYYYITWDDAAGDPEPLTRAIEDRMTPTEFVDWWAEKYDLSSIYDTEDDLAHFEEFARDYGDILRKSPNFTSLEEAVKRRISERQSGKRSLNN